MTDRKTFSMASPVPVGSSAKVQVGGRFFTSGIVSDRSGGLESESHRVFQLLAELLRTIYGVVLNHPGPGRYGSSLNSCSQVGMFSVCGCDCENGLVARSSLA